MGSNGPVDLGYMSDDQIAKVTEMFEQQAGNRFRRFDDMQSAETAARRRSDAGGAGSSESRFEKAKGMAITDSQRLMARKVLSNTKGRVLRRGSRGVSVRALQAFLSDQGFDVGKLDGIFGKQTQKALKDFQRSNKLAVDGRAGDQTFGKVRDLMPEPVEAVASLDMAGADALELPTPPPIDMPVEAPAGQFAEMPSDPGLAGAEMAPPVDPMMAGSEMAQKPFGDEMFSPAPPNLPEQYAQPERSNDLASGIDTIRSTMTGQPYENVAAGRRMNTPEQWQARPGDGLDGLRAALLGKVDQMQQPAAVGAGMSPNDAAMNEMLKALLAR
jgi:peptidoglycan hydrolase-like protein with peptidoglycan-binding domain